MRPGKGEYLRRLTGSMRLQIPRVARELQGSTPPSVFIGSWNYPKVYGGPMIAPVQGDTRFMDMPEEWIPSGRTQEEIASYRLSLVRGMQLLDARRPEEGLADRLREIVLSERSLASEARFAREPSGFGISEEHAPHGPSAILEHFEAESGRWNRALEEVYSDTDLRAVEAILELHRRGIPFSLIQKALSVGALGTGKGRRLVPTRWAITACDTSIADHLLGRVRNLPSIDAVRVHEFRSLRNSYHVILLPGHWRYEWTEAFLGTEAGGAAIFSDREGPRPKEGYSSVGGCYYSCKMAVLEGLLREGRQAGAIVLREAYPGYIPLGVFNVRENVRHALQQPARVFEDLLSAMDHVRSRLTLPLGRFLEEGALLREEMKGVQRTLSDFIGQA
ncbi:MAG: Nre family DNA repair protein [Methanomicrobiales archaeon]|nr:Nre family DNA repair protein [Methanomicrobiales archaeon]